MRPAVAARSARPAANRRVAASAAGNRATGRPGDRATVSLSMPDATETNAGYNCGADFTGFATTSHDMSDSLAVVGGDHLHISLGQPTSFTEQRSISSGGGGSPENDQHIWSFSFTPPGAGDRKST